MKRLEDTPSASRKATMQHAALCYRITKKKGTQILLITSRDTGRWVIPKGWPMAGLTAAEAAECEAFEEAGVKGRLHDDCIGLYAYDKKMGDGSKLPVVVSVFPIEVAKLCTDFPEKGMRDRKWFRPEKASTRVDEPELRALIAAFDPAKLSGRGARNA